MDDLRSKYSLPTWIPEGLVRVTEASRAKAAASVWKTVGKVADDVAKLAGEDPRREKIRASIRISPQVHADEILNRFGFTTDEIRKGAFAGKTVLDLWGGFSGFAPLVASYGAAVTVADPVFLESDPNAYYDQDLARIRQFMNGLKTDIETPEAVEERIMKARIKNLSEYEKVYAGMLFWKGYSPEEFPSIRRVGAFAERLTGIADSSQDYVFACNVLGKPTMDVDGFHKELLRILTPRGMVRTIDHENDLAEENVAKLEELLGKTREVTAFSDDWFRILVS